MNDRLRRRVRRPRKTSRGVRVADVAARALITVGGIGTIVAVTTLCVFLVWVVVPLFIAPAAGEPRELDTLARAEGERAGWAGTDEYLTMGWTCDVLGHVRVFRLSDSRVLRSVDLFEEAPTAFAFDAVQGTFAAGFEDGTVRLGTLGFSTKSPLDDDEVTPELEALRQGESYPVEGGMVERTTSDQLRRQELSLQLADPLTLLEGTPITRLDQVESTTGPVFAALAADGTLLASKTRRRKNLLTGKETLTLTSGTLALEFPPGAGQPRWLRLAGLGDNVMLLWEDGTLWRCDMRNLDAIEVVEKADLLPEPGVTVTAVTQLIGRSSLLVGDSEGRVSVWFRTKPEDAGTPDGNLLSEGHSLAGSGAPVTALAASARSRSVAVGHADGSIVLWYVTSENELLELALPGGEAVERVALAPKDDALVAAGGTTAALWTLDVPHPETSVVSLFNPVWYEGYPEPEHVWQTSSGTDDFEPKYGILPLVFGTIKATIYSLLFGVPLALFAAVYTSEFMSARLKARIKPAIEMMASLPSVVLGFLSALVIAPLVEDVVPGVLTTIVTMPLAALLGGYLWRALPSHVTVAWGRYRLVWVSLCLLVGGLAGMATGPVVERLFFAGDMRQWLTGTVGDGTGGWIILLMPVVTLLVAWFVTAHVNPRLLRAMNDSPPARFAFLDLVKFLAAAVAVIGLCWGLGAVLSGAGVDSRGGILDTYVQRNALVVGFVMGFAIIPIIYTIAEDALSAVPDHLRAASLGAGATPWQTTVRVVIPTAMSGIFSAVMIGFGRAVGETMIVLMAAGNTPVMDWNVFNGFRTLSANIAVELPEAVQNSTHYRMLFLAALVLFAMTFALNTMAESVRLRYRKRRVEL